MNRFFAELQRLYFLQNQQWHRRDTGDGPAGGAITPEIVAASLAGQATVALDLAAPDGRARTLAIVFARAADWELVAGLCQGVQEDFDLPAPAISVSGSSGFGVWFSLAEPVPVELARDFLEALRRRYLAPLPPAALQIHPGPGEAGLLELAPALHGGSGKWSAFIDPAMGSMFADEPGLEMAPSPDRQADILAGFKSIKADYFERAILALLPPAEPAAGAFDGAGGGETAGPAASRLTVGGSFRDPKSFLLAVMNDPAASPADRIEAAKALLPYFEKGRP